MSTTSARGESVDFDRMANDVEKLKNARTKHLTEEVGTTVEKRIIPRGERGKPVRGFKPEKVEPSQSMDAIAPIKLRKASPAAKKSDNPAEAASEALSGILDDLPDAGDLPTEDAYAEPAKKKPVKRAVKKS